jgi:hypothetical protein
MTPCRIAGVGRRFEFVGAASADGDILTLAPTAASKGLDEYKIHLLDPLKIDWSVSVAGGPWMYAGTSANRIYITWREPTASPRFETLFWISCSKAKGMGGEDAATHAPGIVAAIWGEFSDRNVTRVDDAYPMTFYGRLGSMPQGSLAELLADPNRDGSCYAWAELLHGCMKAQGFASRPAQGTPGPLDILEVCVVTADASVHTGATGLVVKNWYFDGEGGGGDWPYVIGLTALPQQGVAGQGVSNPWVSLFADHCVCRVSSTIYDPSYGGDPYSGEAAELDH